MDELEIDPAIGRASDAARLGIAAFFVTLFLTLVYGFVVGLVLEFPWGGVLGVIGAAVSSPAAAAFAAIVYGVLGWMLTRCDASRTQARWWCIGLGAVLGPALTLGAFWFLSGRMTLAAGGIFGGFALAVGAAGGALIWSSVKGVISRSRVFV